MNRRMHAILIPVDARSLTREVGHGNDSGRRRGVGGGQRARESHRARPGGGIGILEEGWERGRRSWWMVQSLSSPTPHRVSALWLGEVRVEIRCDCAVKRALACQHRGAVAQQWALQVAHARGEHSAVLNRCPLCGCLFVYSHEADVDDAQRLLTPELARHAPTRLLPHASPSRMPPRTR
jgi:hypothetical protein